MSLMSYSITCSTGIGTFLFILVGILCGFSMVPGVHISLSPQEGEFS